MASDKGYEFREDCRYTASDEWVRVDDDGVLIGITDFAQSELSDIVFVELPQVGAQLDKGQNFGVVESVKAVGDLYAPISGEIVRINNALEEEPELINQDPYGRGWIIALRADDLDDVAGLWTADDYRANVEERSSG